MQTQALNIPVIPAMTTEAERAFYYETVKANCSRGEIVELGAWLGASTAWIAAGIRDAGEYKRAHVYDRFVSKPGHAAKVKAFYNDHGLNGDIPIGPAFEQFKENLGPDLLRFVEPHQCEIKQLTWDRGPIAVLITDAPKRVPEISSILGKFTACLLPGAIMAWQDFCHFPSYEIAASLYRLREHLEFVAGIVPGTTLAFRVASEWPVEAISTKALSLERWTVDEIDQAWAYWLDGYVPAEKASLFRCGAAMFMCDIGKPLDGVIALSKVLRDDADAVVPKWRYLHQVRPDFVTRYAPLFRTLADFGAFG